MNTKLTSLLILLLVAGTSGVAFGQSQSRQLTLKECVSLAVSNNVDAKKAAIDREIALSKVKEIKGSGLPQIKATGGMDVYPSIPTQLLPGEILGQPGTFIPVQFGTKYTMSGGFEASQVLFNQQLFLGIRAASKANEMYELAQLQTEESILFQVAQSFYQLQQTELQLETIDANLDRLTELAKIVQSQYQNDMARKVDVQRVTVNINNLTTQRKSIESAIETQKNYMKIWMGLELNEDVVISYDETAEIPVLIDESSLTLLDRLDYRSLSLQQELNVLEEKNIKSGYYPTLALYGRYNYQAQRNEFNFFDRDQPWFNTTVFGLQLSVPIFDGFQKHHRVAQNRLSMSKLELDLENLQRNTLVQSVNAKNQLANSLQMVEDQKANIQLAEEVYEQTDLLYKESLASLTEVLDAESSLRDAKINLNNEKLNYQISYLNYLKAVGQLNQLTK